MPQRTRILVSTAILALLAGIMWFVRDRGPSDAERIVTARRHLQAGEYELAASEADRILANDSASAAALLIAGETAMRRERLDDALRYFDRVPDDGDQAAVADFVSGDILLHQGRLSRAETKFRAVLVRQPDHLEAHNRLSLLLGIEGRRWESAPHLFELLRNDRFSQQILLLLGDLEQIVELPDEIRNYRRQAPDDVAPLVGLARIALLDGEVAEAEQCLRQVLAARPDLIEAHVRLGHILLDRADAEFRAWEDALPPAADDHPETWVVRGFRTRRQGRPREAVRNFWEAVRRHPNHQAANYQLGQTLQSLGKAEEASPFLTRAERLQELARDLQWIYDEPSRRDLMERVSRRMEKLDRPWEAWAWYRLALGDDPDGESERRRLDEVHGRLVADRPPRTLFDVGPDLQTTLASYPLPERAVGRSAGSDKSGSPATSGIAFADHASEAGIEFTYFNGGDPTTEGMRMFEFTGGGVAAFDYDADGWPDLHLTQGRPWLSSEPAGDADLRDRTFRNLGGRFEDVTASVGLDDPGYGQGVTVGDYDSDGFDDLYVANIGPNRFFRNNGDGTFSDATAETGTAGGDIWSTSCALVDFNEDALPDLYVVNYVSGDLTRICQKDGVPAACSPAGFDAAEDRVYLNLGDGRFDDQTAVSGIVAPDGKGLGVVAADFDGSGRLSLFVANDTTANFYLANQTPPGGSLAFEEQALPVGLAFDADGKAQACMGVAAGDANADGLLDLFVTNFYMESNALYVQSAGGLFADETRRARLREPSYDLLGFGTQFLDADLDGFEDLVVTNGHVDDRPGIPRHMPPQLFRNRGDGLFDELPAETLGPWFAGKYLGRGLARIDWNRDGLDDFVVSHLDSPAALMTNETPFAGRFLVVRLRGVSGSRDAIGATVQVTAGGRTQTKQLTAGDGYQASNERRLTFGLGANDRVDRLVIRWPSGGEQTFDDLPADSEWLLVEDRDRPLTLPR